LRGEPSLQSIISPNSEKVANEEEELDIYRHLE